jgi:AcrR family transcriptional regulator
VIRDVAEVAIDHRRATAERNAAAILDATERLLERRQALNMAAIAAEAAVSHPTLNAHYKTMVDVVERLCGAPLRAARRDLPHRHARRLVVTTYLALVYGADDHARARRMQRSAALDVLTTTVRDVFAAR